MFPSTGTTLVGDLPKTLLELLQRSATEFGDRTALITSDKRVTYRELVDRVDRYARGLVAGGVGKGSHVALLMENDPDWIAFALAATSLGAVFVPISTFGRADDIAYNLRHADVDHLYMSAGFLANDYLTMLVDILPEIVAPRDGALYSTHLPALRSVVVRGADALPSGCLSWAAFEDSADTVPIEVVQGMQADLDPDDDCYILTTSGTTARPKGVLLTHRALAANGHLIGDYQGLIPDDVVWFYFPLFFSAGCVNVMLGTLSHGAALIVQPTFDAGAALELIERERATAWHLWPHQLRMLLEHPDWNIRDHSGLHKGTAPYDALRESPHPDGLGGVNMYGMTETATAFACTRADESLDIRISTQGHLLPGNEISIVDPETGAPVALGMEGEITVKGPSLMRRYYKVDPAETFDADGFFHTGDLGYVDDAGRVHFAHRLKEMIKTGGINVSPADVEKSLLRIPGVDAAYAFPIPGGDKGEYVGAALAVAAGTTLDEDTLIELCRTEIASYKRPHTMLVLTADQVPMTGSGKVRKNELRDLLIAAMENGEGPVVFR